GYPDQALKKSQEAEVLVQELSYPFSMAQVLTQIAWLHQLLRERQATQERVETVINLSVEQGFALWLAWGTILRGWALMEESGRVLSIPHSPILPFPHSSSREGIAQIHQGLSAWQATGAELYRPYFLALLSEAYGKAGQGEKGLTLLSEALTKAHKSGECFYKAELYRLKGELLQKAESRRQKAEGNDLLPTACCLLPADSPEACFRQAIDIARHQHAKSLELRAVMSLSRLWQKQGKQEEARQILMEIYDWFTEGFDTVDLQEAKVLLEELGEKFS
ncbi:MAG: hypothetical protein L0Y56_21040, partial [Nitrospira sp.]|nr:hypothetical protein [Nitrospira sp.]